jgi:long-chain acyl-CoA synthetase
MAWHRQEILRLWLEDFLDDALQRQGVAQLLGDHLSGAPGVLQTPREYGFNSLDYIKLASRFSASLGMDATGLSDLLLAKRSAADWISLAARSLDINNTKLAFFSSGSTGSPHRHDHSLAALTLEAEYFAHLFSTTQRVVCTVPIHHIFGFIWGVQVPHTLGVTTERLRPQQSMPTTITQMLREGDMIIAIPAFWRLLRELELPLPAEFTAISSTAQLEPEVAAWFREQYPRAVFAEVYGSTESAGVAFRVADDVAYTLLPWWQLSCVDQYWHLQHRTLNQHVQLMDQLVQISERQINVLGRQDRSVKINGHIVNPERVAELLKNYPDVADARVKTTLVDGEPQLHFFLVAASLVTAPESLNKFKNFLIAHLGNLPPPATVVIADDFPRGILDKPLDWQPYDYPVITGVFRAAPSCTPGNYPLADGSIAIEVAPG